MLSAQFRAPTMFSKAGGVNWQIEATMMAMSIAAQPSVEQIRAQFPSLSSGTIYLENAGGTQVPLVVVDAMRDYMLSSYVQLDAGYGASKRATETVASARRFQTIYMNAGDKGQVVFGPSSSQLCKHLADAYANVLEPGDEIIVAQTGHEANVGPWFKLEERGFTVKLWPVNSDTFRCELDELRALMSDRTKIVAFPHSSNLLGDIADARAIADIAHEAGARVVIDGVAYAPHRVLDVQAIDADWYFYSTYKVFGPHMAALFGKAEAFAELAGPGHYFIPEGSPSKWELGCLSHEGCAGTLALGRYLAYVAGKSHTAETPRSTVEAAWETMSALELPLQQKLIGYLQGKPGVRVIGPQQTGASRVAIVSFLSDRTSPPEITAATDAADIGIRHGHAYAARLCEGLGIHPSSGVVRVSFAHYNTAQEVDRLIDVLQGIL